MGSVLAEHLFVFVRKIVEVFGSIFEELLVRLEQGKRANKYTTIALNNWCLLTKAIAEGSSMEKLLASIDEVTAVAKFVAKNTL